jgi:hypothetical protein
MSWLLGGPAAGAATQGAAVGLMRSAFALLLITPIALSEGRASCGKGLPVAGLGHGAIVGLLGGLCVKGLCVGGSCGQLKVGAELSWGNASTAPA